MKTKTLNEFVKAGNALLGEKFGKEEAALLLLEADKSFLRAIKGSAEGIIFLLIKTMAREATFYDTLKATLLCFEENKEQIIKDFSDKE